MVSLSTYSFWQAERLLKILYYNTSPVESLGITSFVAKRACWRHHFVGCTIFLKDQQALGCHNALTGQIHDI